jgi:mannose-6-phosphate isomerase-like protein (cupin superfamily)
MPRARYGRAMSAPLATEWLARTDDVRVRIHTLAPGQGTAWHLHRVVTDDVFGLDAGIEVALRDPDEAALLRPGERQRIAPGRVHRVRNVAAAPARYLLVQATGTYDFVEVP